MPKMKTKSGATKRFKKSGASKRSAVVKVKRANRNHFTSKQSSKKIRQRRPSGVVCKADTKSVKEMIGG